jgi:hypothetical protein
MAGFNFADSYKAANLAPGPEILRLRQEPFAELRATINAQRTLDLTRLYFGLPVPDGTDWFRDAFAGTDDSFSMLDNEREVAVLSSCLLAAAIADGHALAALVLLATAAAGNRQPLLRPEFLDDAREALLDQEISVRRSGSASSEPISVPPMSKVPAAATTALAEAPDWAKVATLFKQVGTEADAAAHLAGKVSSALLSLTAEVANLRQEVDILWWFVGGWSQALERPFGDLDGALAPVMAGLDLAHLTSGPKGPAAAPAVLQRLLTSGRKKRKGEVTIQEAVDAFPPDSFGHLQLREELKRVPDICPVLTALSKAHEIAPSPAWYTSFRTASKLEPTAAFHPLDLAMQVYREMLILKQLD